MEANLAPAADVAEERLVEAFGVFMGAYVAASEAGVDATAVIAANLREAMGDAWHDLPPMVRMMFS